ncbi:hypothetical protein J1N35_018886 [Gossypium stocksii]|uniref:Uncharacterized protein n=1 Tax=Gossypium stocksii TaxID=47602 RepID=A0A9D4A6L0_9ROSI|nr:hypothetical protein J1N35_018886 [Gossypium stocksii]
MKKKFKISKSPFEILIAFVFSVLAFVKFTVVRAEAIQNGQRVERPSDVAAIHESLGSQLRHQNILETTRVS